MSEQMVYRIREWAERYEVNQKNRAWKPGEDRRIGPLPYVRMPVNGHALTPGFRRLNKIAGPAAPSVLGVFTKLLELAADNEADLRGYIVESDGTPMTAENIAETLDWDLQVVEDALNMLCHKDLQWIAQEQFRGFPEQSGDSRDFPTRSDQIRSGQIRTDQPKTRGRARTASARSTGRGAGPDDVPDDHAGPADTDQPAEATGLGAETAEAAPEPARPATITRADTPQYPPNAPGASYAVSDSDKQPTKTNTNNLHDAIAALQQPKASREYLNDLWRRIRRISQDPKPWVQWWTAALPGICQNDDLHRALVDALEYAEDCADPAKRQAKGLGELKKPGAFVTSKLLDAARAAKVPLPELPSRENAA